MNKQAIRDFEGEYWNSKTTEELELILANGYSPDRHWLIAEILETRNDQLE